MEAVSTERGTGEGGGGTLTPTRGVPNVHSFFFIIIIVHFSITYIRNTEEAI